MKRLIIKRALFLLTTVGIALLNLSANAQGNGVALLGHWTDTSLVASTAHGNVFNDVWGFDQEGRRYAVIGSTAGAHFFDITDPSNIIEVDFVAGKSGGANHVHRDYHDYKGYIYMVADQGKSSLQIADLSYLPDSVHLVYDSDSLAERCHNIFIDTARAKIYFCANSTSRGYFGLEVADLSNPVNPVRMDSYPQSLYGTVHDIYVRNDTGYLNSARDGLNIVDFSNIPNDSLLASLTVYPDQGYNHSGWLSEDGKHYVFADETHGKAMKVLDVSDLNNINVLGTFGTDVGLGSIPHNLMLFDDKIYVSYYYNGFRMFDMSNPTAVTEMAHYSTSKIPIGTRYKGAWGVFTFRDGIVLISDMQEGLFVLSVGPALSLQETEGVDNLSIVPNPSTDGQLSILGISGELREKEVFDLGGKRLFIEKNNSNQLDLSFLGSGLYILKVSDGNGVQSRKLIINK